MALVLRAKGFTFTKFFQEFVLGLVPNAAGAYSTRLLSAAYTGAALRVRRSSDNTEQDIGFSGADLDESALLSFVGSGDGFVRTWYDQSGNSRNAAQTTNALQPRIVSSGVVDKVNDRPTLFWQTGGDNELVIASPAPTTQTNTAFSVFRSTNAHLGYVLAGTNGSFSVLQQSNSIQTARAGEAILASTSISPGVIIQATNGSTAASTFSAANGGAFATDAAGSFSQPVSRIGQNSGVPAPHVNALAEVIYYDSNVMADRSLIELNQSVYFGIA